MELKLERCTIRPWRTADLASLVRHANDRDVWINLRDRFPHPYTADDGRSWIELCATQHPTTHFAVEVGGTAAGGIGVLPGDDVHRHDGEIGYWLGRSFWGQGIMTEAVRAMTERAFSEYGLCRLHAAVFAWNEASMRVLEKAGYAREGRLRNSVFKDGQTIDAILYARLRDENPGGPS